MLDNPYLRHHKRFLAAMALGLAGWFLAAGAAPEIRLLVAGDVFFIAYLAQMLVLTLRTTKADLLQRAEAEDEGILLIAGLTFAAVVFSLISILSLLNRSGGPDTGGLAFAIASVPLAWLTLHVMAAQHYANLYYGLDEGPPLAAEAELGKGAGDAMDGRRGGLDFPGGEAPGAWDFLYFSLVIGMTAQVSDVTISSSRLRRVSLAHAVASFFFNTVLLAIAVNAAVSGGH